MELETESSLVSDKELPFPENAANFSSVDKGDVSPSFLMYRLISDSMKICYYTYIHTYIAWIHK